MIQIKVPYLSSSSLNIEVLVKDGALLLTNQEGNFITFSSDQSVQRKVSNDHVKR
jgi:hypothetical protein